MNMDQHYDRDIEQLAERGWADMRRTLDREMPEQKRRRPFLWWWISGIAASLLLFGSLALYNPYSTQEATPAASAPVADLPAPATFNTAMSPAQQATEPASGLPATEHPSSIPGRRTENTPALIIATPEGATASPAQQETTASKQNPSPSADDAANTPALSNALPAIDLLPSVAPKRLASVAVPNRSSVATTLLKPAATNRPLQLGLYAGTLLAADSRPGLHGGLQLSWQPLRRWGLRSGIGYQYQPVPAMERPISTITGNQYAEATGNYDVFQLTGNVYADSLNTILVPVKALHRLEIPLELYWQPLRRWKLSAGALLQYTAGVSTADQGLLTRANKILDVSGSNVGHLAAKDLRGWDVRAATGLSFSPARRLELGLHWRWQINDFLPGKKLESLDYGAPGLQHDFYNASRDKKEPGQLSLQAVFKF
jgi:hypothetical protein